MSAMSAAYRVWIQYPRRRCLAIYHILYFRDIRSATKPSEEMFDLPSAYRASFSRRPEFSARSRQVANAWTKYCVSRHLPAVPIHYQGAVLNSTNAGNSNSIRQNMRPCWCRNESFLIETELSLSSLPKHKDVFLVAR
jgi:hypothetical protein